MCIDLPTENRVPPVRMSPERKDMGVIGRDHGEGVLLAGHLGSPFDGPVKLHRLSEGPLGYTVVVAVVNSPPWETQRSKLLYEIP